jgi:hypothetical protein
MKSTRTLPSSTQILSENLSFFKTCENSYTGPLCITDPQYGDDDKEILSFGQFMAQTDHFR